MEELLNKLIQRGWKPFGKEAKEIYIDKNEITIERLNGFRVVYTTRQISSIDSGLWQFCVENKLVNRERNYTREYVDENKNYILFSYAEGIIAEYYIIESALRKEENLEKFLLENIKI